MSFTPGFSQSTVSAIASPYGKIDYILHAGSDAVRLFLCRVERRAEIRFYVGGDLLEVWVVGQTKKVKIIVFVVYSFSYVASVHDSNSDLSNHFV